jgi:hypothetical protein
VTNPKQNPVQLAYDSIDEVLVKAGWIVQSKKHTGMPYFGAHYSLTSVKFYRSIHRKTPRFYGDMSYEKSRGHTIFLYSIFHHQC